MERDQGQLKLLANCIRVLSAECVEQANSGHPGLPLGAADLAAVLWTSFLRFNPEDPHWPNRDRFVLSAGHGSMLLYSCLHLFGYPLSLEELKNFRQWGSKTPGHPEFDLELGIECTTGPLGQGFANGVGMALSQAMLASRYGNDAFDFRVFGIVSDGDLMEGISSEAASLAGHLGLGNLVYLYDDNLISLAGPTSVCFSEDIPKKFEAMAWDVVSVDGHDFKAIRQALTEALKQDKPSLICARTTIGYGSPNKAGSYKVHGAPLGADEFQATKEALSWEHPEPFYIPDQVKDFCAGVVAENKTEYRKWSGSFGDLANKLKLQVQVPRSELKQDLLAELSDVDKEASRSLSGKAIQIIAKHIPGFIGGSADLEPSTKTLINDSEDITKGNYHGRNIRFGVREHAMGAMVNGLAYDSSWIPFCSTFLVFSDYLRPAIRLAALSKLQSLFIFTHDSFWVGEDGPTHQPIEHAAALRAIPNLYVFRPADGLEVAMSYLAALERKDGPSCLLLSRQNLNKVERASDFDPDQILKGGYVVSGALASEIVLIGTGSELACLQEVAKSLEAAGKAVRLVSIPCLEIFLEQDLTYRHSVIPADAKKVILEAGVAQPWHALTSRDDLIISRDNFGASAPGKVLSEQFGFSPQAVEKRILEII